MAARHDALALYRALLRVAHGFPDRPMGRKLQYNARELFRLRRDERDPANCARALADGRLALQVYHELAADPLLLRAILRKQPPASPQEQRNEQAQSEEPQETT